MSSSRKKKSPAILNTSGTLDGRHRGSWGWGLWRPSDSTNPLGAILTGALILRHSGGLEAEAQAIESSVRKVLEQGFRTPDLMRGNPSAAGDFTVLSTTEMGAKVRETVKQLLAVSC